MRRLVGPILAALAALAAPSARAEDGLGLSRAICGALDPAAPDAAEARQRVIAACTTVIRSGRVTPQILAAAFNNRAAARLAAGERDAARADLEEALFLAPDLAPALFNRALLLQAGGAPAEAAAARAAAARQSAALGALPLGPETAPRLAAMGSIGPEAAFAAGPVPQTGTAVPRDKDVDAKQAAAPARRPRPPSGEDMTAATELFRRAYARARHGDTAGALADYSAALARDPSLSVAWNNRGILRARLGDRAGALADFDAAIHSDQRNSRAFNNRGLLRLEEGDAATAARDFSAALRLDPHLALAFQNRGNARMALGETAAAMQDLERAIQLDPRLARAYASRGTLRARLGDEAGARADYAMAARLDPASVAPDRGARVPAAENLGAPK